MCCRLVLAVKWCRRCQGRLPSALGPANHRADTSRESMLVPISIGARGGSVPLQLWRRAVVELLQRWVPSTAAGAPSHAWRDVWGSFMVHVVSDVHFTERALENRGKRASLGPLRPPASGLRGRGRH